MSCMVWLKGFRRACKEFFQQLWMPIVGLPHGLRITVGHLYTVPEMPVFSQSLRS